VQEPNPTGHTEHTREQDTLDQRTGDQGVGNVPPDPASRDSPAEAHARPREDVPLKVSVKRRLDREGRWAGRIKQERNEMMKLARKRGMSKDDAQQWTYSELDRLYPPIETGTLSSFWSGHRLCKGDKVP